ncbi:MAG: hypothetical protein L6R41_002947 [Letrouitia leprolyta]|nr:MAG: hypothetical protein L6R41_002947 [Letrouitia leprolyta]
MDIVPIWQRWVVLEDLQKIYPLTLPLAQAKWLQPTSNHFPFDKLPPELQLNVLRFTMPQHGFRPLPLPSDFNRIDPPCSRYVEALRRERTTVFHLFQVNRWISAESMKIFYAETVLHIDVAPTRIRFGGTVIREPYMFQTYTFLQSFQAFTRFRNYELHIHLRELTRLKALNNPWVFSKVCHSITEWLRMISDALSTNDHVDHLTVKLLGLCALGELDPPMTFDPTPKIVESLAPLTRVLVNKTTVFSAHYHAQYRILYEPCSDPSCQDWIRGIQEAVGPMEGAQLDKQEELWKQLKCENRIPPPRPSERCFSLAASRWFRRAWRRLNTGSDIEPVVGRMREHFQEEYRDWQRNLNLARQCQYQKLGKDAQHPIMIDDDTPDRNGEDLTWWSP